MPKNWAAPCGSCRIEPSDSRPIERQRNRTSPGVDSVVVGWIPTDIKKGDCPALLGIDDAFEAEDCLFEIVARIHLGFAGNKVEPPRGLVPPQVCLRFRRLNRLPVRIVDPTNQFPSWAVNGCPPVGRSRRRISSLAERLTRTGRISTSISIAPWSPKNNRRGGDSLAPLFQRSRANHRAAHKAMNANGLRARRSSLPTTAHKSVSRKCPSECAQNVHTPEGPRVGRLVRKCPREFPVVLVAFGDGGREGVPKSRRG